MPYTISDIDNHLIGLTHSGTLKRIRNKNEMYERVGASFVLQLKTLESMNRVSLPSLVYDDQYQYELPDDFLQLIDLAPEDQRTTWDKAFRNSAGEFDARKAFDRRTVSLEGLDGQKIIRINWRSRQGKTLNSMTSLTANGTWDAVATASNLAVDTIVKKTSGSSIRFDVNASGDGIANTTMTQVDLTDEDGQAQLFAAMYFPENRVSSVSAQWGNDLTTNFWSSVAQTTQFSGVPFRAGWNYLAFPWASATETGTVNPATIDSLRFTLAKTGGALEKVRIDRAVFAIGRAFEMTYYSKFLFKSATTNLRIAKPTSPDDYVMIDIDTLPHFLMLCLQAAAHQMEGSDSTFDIEFAEKQLAKLFPAYKGMNPAQGKKMRNQYSRGPRWNFRQ